MLDFNRRTFLKTLSAAAGVSLISISKARASSPKARVIVVGGGYGGASAAKYLRLMDPGIEVTLFEKNKSYISCPLSNEVLSGDREMVTLERGYDGLVKRGVKVVHSEVTRIDPVAKKLAIAEGEVFDYDYLIVSPGIEFDFSAIRNFTPELAETKITHAWRREARPCF